jgi:N-terminal acetyltransferase B complex non-catalytic subunit
MLDRTKRRQPESNTLYFYASSKQEQKESRPGDDLILLVLQQLLQGEPSEAELGFSAVVIESALQHSPDNAYLKIAAMFLYSQLDAVSRSWILFQELYIKHIQHESCAYLILPLLRAGGFYRETIIVCQEIIRLQTTNARDAGTFAGRAMENGTMSKADEFLSFQLTKLNRSLTTLEAKGLVLDCAPMFVNDERQRALGAMHGIVGEEFDLGRARCMVTEAHRPLAAFSLLQVKGSIGDSVEQFSDNRDFTILSHDLLNPRTFDSKEQIVSDSIRRGHHHNLLIRCVLIVDLTKGPKKGKVVAASSALKKRTASLLSSIAAARVYCEKSTHPLGYQELSQTMLSLCGVVTVLSVGRFSQEDSSLSSPDDLETREEKTCDFLKQALDSTTKARHQLDLTNDARVCRVGELLPDYLVPIIALLKMCTQLMELYGWGRRKRKTRRCAAAFSDLALLMVSLLGDMQTCIAR